ncbi:S-methyl-5-thioribose-1-phosphate isomerase [Sporothrix eucalyptigena]
MVPMSGRGRRRRGPVVVDGRFHKTARHGRSAHRRVELAFDMMLSELIDVIVTEKGVVEKNAYGEFDLTKVF